MLVLERRERLGGACTLERPFADERFVISPCAYVLGLLDQRVIDDLELSAAACAGGSPTRTSGSRSTTAPRSASSSTTRAPRPTSSELGVSKADIDGYWAHQKLYDDVRKLLRKGERDAWEGERRPGPRSRRCSAAARR